MSFLGMDLAGAIAGTTGQVVYDLTLTRRTVGAVNPAAIANGGAVTETEYAARGYASDYRTGQRDGTRVRDGDRIVTVYPSTEMVAADIIPEADDRIVLTTPEGTEAYIVVAEIARAPSGALYRLQVRPA